MIKSKKKTKKLKKVFTFEEYKQFSQNNIVKKINKNPDRIYLLFYSLH